MIQIKDLVGKYSIIGKNQNIEQSDYKGTLTLSLDENDRINAKWMIGSQQQFLRRHGYVRDKKSDTG